MLPRTVVQGKKNDEYEKAVMKILRLMLEEKRVPIFEALVEEGRKAKPCVVFKNEDDFWTAKEIYCILMQCTAMATQDILLGLKDCTFPPDGPFLEILKALVENVGCAIQRKLDKAMSDKKGYNFVPLVMRAAKIYSWTPNEALFVQLAILAASSTCPQVLSAYGKAWHDKYAWCQASKVEQENFKRPSRLHMREGLFQCSDPVGETPRIRMPMSAVKLFRGWTLSRRDRLQLTGSSLLKCSSLAHENRDNEAVQNRKDSKKERQKNVGGSEKDQHEDSKIVEMKTPPKTARIPSSSSSSESVHDAVDEIINEETEIESKIRNPSRVTSAEERSDEDKTRPYDGDLQYLSHQFQRIVALANLCVAQRKKTIKENSDEDDERRRRFHDRYLPNAPVSTGVPALEAKLRIIQNDVAERVRETKRIDGKFEPRIERLRAKMNLTTFETDVLLYLCGMRVSPVVKALRTRRGEMDPRIGDILEAFCKSFEEQVERRTSFYKTSTLLEKGLISVTSPGSWQGTGDLTDCRCVLDRRIQDCILGLEGESSEVAEGSNLYTPKVDINDCVLSEELKNEILGQINNFRSFREHLKQLGRSGKDICGVRKGLVIMFCGASGTGKTHTANAIAAKAKKKVLLVNFPMLHAAGRRERRGDGADSNIRSVFREAELSDAIVFFDECESLFSARGSGGSHTMTALLTEIERFEGIIVLATNRPFDLDEAMYRRITSVHKFQRPSYMYRKKIWKLLTKDMDLAEDVDIDAISVKYELTGGFIKNAIQSAYFNAVGRAESGGESKNVSRVVLTNEDIVSGCRNQMRGALQMNDFSDRVVPRAGIESLRSIVSKSVVENIEHIINLEKARSVLLGRWGFDAADRDGYKNPQSSVAVLWGPLDAGVMEAAESLGFELGKPLKVVNLRNLLGGQSRGTSKRGGNPSGYTKGSKSRQAIHAAFSEARLQDAVLFLEGFIFSDSRGDKSQNEDLLALAYEAKRFPGVCCFHFNTEKSMDIFISQIPKSLVEVVTRFIEFRKPNKKLRVKLWKLAIPDKVPRLQDGKWDKHYEDLANLSLNFTKPQIDRVVYHACAKAIMRPAKKDRVLKYADLVATLEFNKRKGESEMLRAHKASTYI